MEAEPAKTCPLPDPGWICSRPAGHEGPCAARRRRGRPPGVKSKTFTRPLAASSSEQRDRTDGRLTPPSSVALGDYRHADPETIIARQFTMLDWAQQATRNEMQRAMQGKGLHIAVNDIEKLEKLSNAIVRAIDALKKSADLADELSKRLTPEQLMEAALKKRAASPA